GAPLRVDDRARYLGTDAGRGGAHVRGAEGDEAGAGDVEGVGVQAVADRGLAADEVTVEVARDLQPGALLVPGAAREPGDVDEDLGAGGPPHGRRRAARQVPQAVGRASAAVGGRAAQGL